jgi:hypothetical protein
MKSMLHFTSQKQKHDNQMMVLWTITEPTTTMMMGHANNYSKDDGDGRILVVDKKLASHSIIKNNEPMMIQHNTTTMTISNGLKLTWCPAISRMQPIRFLNDPFPGDSSKQTCKDS